MVAGVADVDVASDGVEERTQVVWVVDQGEGWLPWTWWLEGKKAGSEGWVVAQLHGGFFDKHDGSGRRW